MQGNSTSGRLGSGASPGLIAGASEFPRGEGVLHDLNGSLDYRHFGRLRKRVQIFGGSEKKIKNCAMRLRVCVCYMFKFNAGGFPVRWT